jgi:hypothetical protein
MNCAAINAATHVTATGVPAFAPLRAGGYAFDEAKLRIEPETLPDRETDDLVSFADHKVNKAGGFIRCLAAGQITVPGVLGLWYHPA